MGRDSLKPHDGGAIYNPTARRDPGKAKEHPDAAGRPITARLSQEDAILVEKPQSSLDEMKHGSHDSHDGSTKRTRTNDDRPTPNDERPPPNDERRLPPNERRFPPNDDRRRPPEGQPPEASRTAAKPPEGQPPEASWTAAEHPHPKHKKQRTALSCVPEGDESEGAVGKHESLARDRPPTKAKAEDLHLALKYATNIGNNKRMSGTTLRKKMTNEADPAHHAQQLDRADHDKGFEAMQRLIAATSGFGKIATPCMNIAEMITRAEAGTADKPTLGAVFLMLSCVAANEELLSRGLEICMRLFLNDPSRKVASRARHGIQTMLDANGARGYAALRFTMKEFEGQDNAPTDGVLKSIETWKTQAKLRLSQLPLSDHQWLARLRRKDADAVTPPYEGETDEENCNAHWKMGEGPCARKTTRQYISWNANSLFKRVRNGEFGDMLSRNEGVDVIHITELRRAMLMTDLENWELRQALEVLGFRHAIWNWCKETPGLHGSAILSRIAIDKVAFGLSDGHSDPEGRTITTEFKDHSTIWTYTPCSKMNEPGRDDRRHTYDEAFNEKYKSQAKVTGGPVFAAGDFNLAPHASDSTVPEEEAHLIPSNKPFERENYYKLLVDNNLANVAEVMLANEGSKSPPQRTWKKGIPGRPSYMAMRIDHVLAPRDRIGTTPKIYPSITAFHTTRETYGSDHNANCFTMTSKPALARIPRGRPTVVPQDALPSEALRLEYQCRVCGEGMRSRNKLHLHVTAFGHDKGPTPPVFRKLQPCCTARAPNPNKAGCTYVICNRHGLPALARGDKAACSHEPLSDAPSSCTHPTCLDEAVRWLVEHEAIHKAAKLWSPPHNESGVWNPGKRTLMEEYLDATAPDATATPATSAPPLTPEEHADKLRLQREKDESTLLRAVCSSLRSRLRGQKAARLNKKAMRRLRKNNRSSSPRTLPALPPESEACVAQTILEAAASSHRRREPHESREDEVERSTLSNNQLYEQNRPAVLQDGQLYTEARDHQSRACTAAATTTNAPPYTPFRDGNLPHEKTRIVPETELPMGVYHWMVKSLWDTGACYNIMSAATAERLHLDLDTKCELPILEMADKSTTQPLGSVMTDVQFDSMVMEVQFFVFEHAPYPTILGSDFLEHMKAVISYDDNAIRLHSNGQVAKIQFNPARAEKLNEKAMMRPLEDVVIPAESQAKVPIKFDIARHDTAERWGLITDAGSNEFRVATGITCAVKDDNVNYYCQVINPTSKPMLVDTSKPICYFTPIDKDDYTLRSSDAWDADPVLHEDGLASDDDGYDVPVDCRPRSATACSSTLHTSEADDIDKEWKTKAHLEDLDLGSARETLSTPQFNRLRRTILRHHDLFDQRPKDPPPHADRCTIELQEPGSWAARTRQMSPLAREQLRALTGDQLLKKIIEPSSSPYTSPVVLVPKKGGGIRFAVDYRALNEKIAADSYTLPRVDEALASLNGNSHFTSLDMKDAFWSVPLDEKSREYTAFQTPDGLFQYRRMPMGLKTASAVFCRYVDKMLGHMKWTQVMAYVDDLLIFGKTLEEHLDSLDKLLPRLQSFNMTLGAKKCTFFAPSVKFLGHIVDKHGIHPDPKKIEAIKAINLPQNPKEMEKALGLLQYYRRFVANYTHKEKPLRTKLNTPTAWAKIEGVVHYNDKEKESWETLKKALTTEPILGHPDWSQPFELHTDACYIGLGASLVQKIDGKERVISYASRTLAPPEKNYNIWELECLAIIWATKLFRMYLQCATFKILTDSTAAKHIMSNPAPDSSGRIMRWSLSLQDFNYTTEHRKGKRHGDADGLSRNPLQSTEPYGEGPTTIEPATMLSAKILAVGPPRATACTCKHFEDEDKSAHNAKDFKHLQDKDKYCEKITKNLMTPETATEGRYYRDPTRSDLVTRRTKENRPDQVLVPDSLKAFTLRRYHGLPITGHTGRKKTYEALTARFYWPGMKRDLIRWIKSCLTCCRRKTPRALNSGKPGTTCNSQKPWDTIAIDIVSACKTSKGGYTKILTIIDTFTRYVLAIPLYNANAEEIGNALFRELFCKHGKPKRIHSDEGKEFVNAALTAMFKRWDITHTSTGGYQPQANPVERYHRFMNSSMTMLSTKFGNDWPSYIPAATFAYNASICASTDHTPFELVYGGTKPNLLQDINLDIFDETHRNPTGTPDYKQFKQAAVDTLREAYKAVRMQQEKMSQTNKDYINAKRGAHRIDGEPPKLPEFEIGDHVIHWEPALPKIMQTPEQRLANITTTKAPKKWKNSWTGPHIVTGKKADATGHRYDFYHRGRGITISTHVNKLRSYTPWSEGIMSTSAELDEKALYKSGSWVANGSLVVVPLLEPYPFGIALLLDCDENGDMELQWMGNASDSVTGTYEPGWKASTTRAHTAPYYSPTAKKSTHVPYTTAQDDLHMNQRDVLIHDFKLTTKGFLPAPLLRAIARHPYVWWDPYDSEPSKKAQAAATTGAATRLVTTTTQALVTILSQDTHSHDTALPSPRGRNVVDLTTDDPGPTIPDPVPDHDVREVPKPRQPRNPAPSGARRDQRRRDNSRDWRRPTTPEESHRWTSRRVNRRHHRRN